MNMRKKRTLISIVAGLLALGLCSCQTNPAGGNTETESDTTQFVEELETTEEETTFEEETTLADDTTTQFEETTTEEETTLPEELQGVEVSLTSFKPDGTAFDAAVTANVDFEGEIVLTFKQGTQSVERAFDLDLVGHEAYEIGGEDVPFLNGTYTIDAQVTSQGYVVDEYTLNFRNGVPLLSLRSVDLVVEHMPLQEKANFVVAWQAPHHMAARTHGIKSYDIKSVVLADGPGGVRTDRATVAYPVGTNLAATWDREMIETVAASIGDDCVQLGVGVLLGPGMNIQKNVRCGRNFEYFSEDPFLTGMMAASYTQGVQSQNVGVALKHFAVNNQETDRGMVSADVTERALREIYLRGFEYAVKEADPYTIMSSYNRVNGAHTSTRRDLLETILRDEFGFGGMVMSDWGASGGRVGLLSAGNDLACGYSDPHTETRFIVEAVQAGRLDEELLNVSCKRVLTLLARCSAQDQIGTNEIENRDQKDALVRRAGAESMVLLKNEGATLPMQGGNIALFAANSYNLIYCGGGSGSVLAEDVKQLPDSIVKFDGFSVNDTVEALYVDSELSQYDITPEIAAEAARESDYAIFTIARVSVEGNDHKVEKGDFLLSDIERSVLENVAEAFHAEGKKVIVLLNVGNPVEVVSWWDLADAILLVGFAGEEIGDSIMDVLTGAVNPSAKLTSTWPLSYDDAPDKAHFGTSGSTLYYDDIYVGYRYYTTFDVNVAYPFGYGLSYTSYEYSDFSVEGANGEYELSVTVKNTGNTAGREIVQFYVTKPEYTNEHPEIELVGFGKTDMLQPGQEQTVTVKVGAEELKTYDTPDAQWIIEKGPYTFHVGASVMDVRDQATVTQNREILVLQTVNACEPTRDLNVLTKY